MIGISIRNARRRSVDHDRRLLKINYNWIVISSDLWWVAGSCRLMLIAGGGCRLLAEGVPIIGESLFS